MHDVSTVSRERSCSFVRSVEQQAAVPMVSAQQPKECRTGFTIVLYTTGTSSWPVSFSAVSLEQQYQ